MFADLIVRKMQCAEKSSVVALAHEAKKQLQSVVEVTGLPVPYAQTALGGAYVQVGVSLAAIGAKLGDDQAEAIVTKVIEYHSALMFNATSKTGDPKADAVIADAERTVAETKIEAATDQVAAAA